jgi:hypothetical protein
MSATPSCQPPVIKQFRRLTIGNVWIHGWKHSRAKPCVFPVFFRVVASGVAEVGSLFPRFRASIGHRTVARGRFAIQIVIKRLRRSERFWKMRFAKCSPNCSKSSVCQKVKKHLSRSRSEHFWNMRSATYVSDCSYTTRFAFQNRKK